MFSFLHRTDPQNPSRAIREALDKDGLPAGIRCASQLRVIQSMGCASDQQMTRFRLFDPLRAAEHDLTVRDFTDLDTYPDLILKAGYIEPDGSVIITRRWPDPEAEANDHRRPPHPDQTDARSARHGDRRANVSVN
jgi:hypothetical protein